MARPFVAPRTVRRLQDKAEAAMRYRLDVERRPNGATTGAYQPVAGLTNLPCDFAFSAPAESVQADAMKATTQGEVRVPPRLFAPGLPSIGAADRLRITHDKPGVPSPLVVTVRGGDQPGSAVEVVRRIIVTRAAPGG